MPKAITKSMAIELDESKTADKKVKAGHFLFVQDENHLTQVASYDSLKSFRQGVKEKIKALRDDEPIPLWVRFSGQIKVVSAERTRDVKVKL